MDPLTHTPILCLVQNTAARRYQAVLFPQRRWMSMTSGGVEVADSLGAEKNVKLVVRSVEQPPQETEQAIWKRRYVILSFWAIVLVLGLPIWWKTTTVYRAGLPLRSMNDWADGKVCTPVFPLNILLDAPALRVNDAQNLLALTQHVLDDLNEFSAHHLRLTLLGLESNTCALGSSEDDNSSCSTVATASKELTAALTVRLVPSESAPTPGASLHSHASVLDIFYAPSMVPVSSTSSSPLGTYIANTLRETFAEEQVSLAYLMATSKSASSSNSDFKPLNAKPMSVETLSDLERRTTRSMKYAASYHLTFSLFTPEASPSDWEIESAFKSTMVPLLSSLSPISNFTIDTQVQPYASFSTSVQPAYDESQRAWMLSRSDLGGFINAAEWPLTPSIGTGPTINFILYVPSPSQKPLLVEEGYGSNSWLVPQWGGVVIYNQLEAVQDDNKTLSAEQLREPLLTFAHQLLSLLGVPNSPPSLSMRLSTLTRLRAASLLVSASSTLGSLARLTLALPSISIPDSVHDSVLSTMAHLDASCISFRNGDFSAALRHAREAESQAEKAFFERSMVGQVYFPEEHKVAVYLPLLGPVAVPLVLSAVKEVRGFIQRRKKTKVL